MAITHDQFLELLREEGLKFARFDTGTAVLLPFGSCTVLADLIEDGEAVLVAAGGVFNLSGCSNKAAGLEWRSSLSLCHGSRLSGPLRHAKRQNQPRAALQEPLQLRGHAARL